MRGRCRVRPRRRRRPVAARRRRAPGRRGAPRPDGPAARPRRPIAARWHRRPTRRSSAGSARRSRAVAGTRSGVLLEGRRSSVTTTRAVRGLVDRRARQRLQQRRVEAVAELGVDVVGAQHAAQQPLPREGAFVGQRRAADGAEAVRSPRPVAATSPLRRAPRPNSRRRASRYGAPAVR